MGDVRAQRRDLGVAVAAIVAVTSALGLAVELWYGLFHAVAPDLLEGVVPLLSLSYEANVPTWVASSLLLACALAAVRIAADHPPGAPWRWHWWGVPVALAWASLDEAVGFHEHLGGHFALGGVLYFDWVIWAVVLVAGLALIYLPWLRALPAPTGRRLVVAAAVFLTGAVVMELPLGLWTEHAGADNLGYALIDWVEETLELVGAALALRAFVAEGDAR